MRKIICWHQQMQENTVDRQLLFMKSKTNKTSRKLEEWELPPLSWKQTPEQLCSSSLLMWESCFPAAYAWRWGRVGVFLGPSGSLGSSGKCTEGCEKSRPRKTWLFPEDLTAFTPLEFSHQHRVVGYQINVQNPVTYIYVQDLYEPNCKTLLVIWRTM